jgi:hypothetical protein
LGTERRARRDQGGYGEYFQSHVSLLDYPMARHVTDVLYRSKDGKITAQPPL